MINRRTLLGSILSILFLSNSKTKEEFNIEYVDMSCIKINGIIIQSTSHVGAVKIYLNGKEVEHCVAASPELNYVQIITPGKRDFRNNFSGIEYVHKVIKGHVEVKFTNKKEEEHIVNNYNLWKKELS